MGLRKITGMAIGLAAIGVLAAYLLADRQPGIPLVADVPISAADMVSAPIAVGDGSFLVLERMGSDAPPVLQLVTADGTSTRVSATLPDCGSTYIENPVADADSVFVVAVCPENDSAYFGRLDIAAEKVVPLQEMSRYDTVSPDRGRLVASSQQYDRTTARYVTPRCPALSLGSAGALAPIPALTFIGPPPAWPADRFLSSSCTQTGYIGDLDLQGSLIAVVAGPNPMWMGGCTSDGSNELCGLYLIDLEADTVRLIIDHVRLTSVSLTDDGEVVATGRIGGKSGLWKIGSGGERVLLCAGEVSPASLSRDHKSAIIGTGGDDETSDIIAVALGQD